MQGPAPRPRRASAPRARSRVENVLREGLRLERVPDPSILVLFGATGDLAHRKVIPALYQLWRTNLLPHEFVLLADRPAASTTTRRSGPRSARRSSSSAGSCRSTRTPGARSPSGSATSGSTSTTRPASTRWPTRLDDARQGARDARQPALLPRHPAVAVRRRSSPSSGGSGSTTSTTTAAGGGSSSRSRSATTSNSAKRLNREVGKVFRESQVYRIDHYLGKETVRNLLVFRFGNGIFEPLWNRRYVDHVQITVAESIGIENRGAFYEETGASRDVLQNHLLQLVSLVAMEPPATFEADALRDEKVKVLRAIEIDPDDVPNDVVRGQYGPGWVAATQVPGYREEPDVDPESETETFVAARLDDRRLALVRRPVLRPDRQAPAQASDRDRHPVPRGPAPPVQGRGRRARTRTCSRSASSRTRGSCCGSGPRSRASGSTSAR